MVILSDGQVKFFHSGLSWALSLTGGRTPDRPKMIYRVMIRMEDQSVLLYSRHASRHAILSDASYSLNYRALSAVPFLFHPFLSNFDFILHAYMHSPSQVNSFTQSISNGCLLCSIATFVNAGPSIYLVSSNFDSYRSPTVATLTWGTHTINVLHPIQPTGLGIH